MGVLGWESWGGSPGVGVLCRESWVGNPGLEILDRGSWVGSPGSGVGSPGVSLGARVLGQESWGESRGAIQFFFSHLVSFLNDFYVECLIFQRLTNWGWTEPRSMQGCI